MRLLILSAKCQQILASEDTCAYLQHMKVYKYIVADGQMSRGYRDTLGETA